MMCIIAIDFVTMDISERISRFTSRDEIATLATPGGVGVELGVAAGKFSDKLLRKSPLALLYSIDAWAGDRGHDDTQYEVAKDLLEPFGGRSRIIRARFDVAVNQFQDKSLDFIYIDGYAHTGQEQGRTLDQWWPKLKPGGIFAGDDYSEKYPLVIRYVDEFVAERKLTLHVVKDWNGHHSWLVRKP